MTEAVPIQITIDCADPGHLASFWSAALRYAVQFDDPTNAWAAVVDPERRGPRVVFQRVPDPKTGKATAHLDLQVGQAALSSELHRLTGLGAQVLRNLVLDPQSETFVDAIHLDDTSASAWRRFILADPEGNEFCLQ
jgi:hypothetical protein